MSWNSLNPQNSNNPFDTIGLWHNELLDHFIANVNSFNLTSSFCAESTHKIAMSLSNYAQQNFAFSPTDSGFVQGYGLSKALMLFPGSDSNFPSLESLLSSTLFQFVQDIKDIVSGLTYGDYATVRDGIINLENGLEGNTNLPLMN